MLYLKNYGRGIPQVVRGIASGSTVRNSGIADPKIFAFVDNKLFEDASTTRQTLPQGYGPVPNNIQVQRAVSSASILRLSPRRAPIQTQPRIPSRTNVPRTTKIEYAPGCPTAADIAVITQCSISELYKTGDQAVIALAKKCERRRCGHIPEPLIGHDCITACLNIEGENKHRYILATQDEELRAEMRSVPGVPMVYIRRAVMIMEPPSPASLTRRDAREREKLGGLEKRKREGGEDEGEEGVKRKKRKGPKEPNPLSVKKKKKRPMERMDDTNKVDDGNNGIGNVVYNIVGDVTESIRRTKVVRRRKKHKRLSKGTEDSIPAVREDGEKQKLGSQ